MHSSTRNSPMKKTALLPHVTCSDNPILHFSVGCCLVDELGKRNGRMQLERCRRKNESNTAQLGCSKAIALSKQLELDCTSPCDLRFYIRGLQTVLELLTMVAQKMELSQRSAPLLQLVLAKAIIAHNARWNRQDFLIGHSSVS